MCRLPRHSCAAGALFEALTPLDETVVSWIQPQEQAGMISLQHSTVASVESHEHGKNRLSEQTTLSLMHRGHQLTPPELGLHHCCCQGTSQQISAQRQC